MKTYVLTVSRYFPKTHKRAEDPTYFVEKILSEQISCGLISRSEVKKHEPFSVLIFNTDEPKIHTCRANYDLWKKRIDNVSIGEAILSVRYWSGKPYNSKQVEICQLNKDSGVGVQRLTFQHDRDGIYGLKYPIISRTHFGDIKILAANDGLSLEDFKEWFKGYDLTKPMAIIHFTKFRYLI